MKQIVSDYESEKNENEKILKKEKIKNVLWALTWIKHLEECLKLFDKENEQGKGIIIKGLKEDENFFPFLSQLEIGLKLKQQNYKVILEDSSIISKPRIDILASKNNNTLVFEIEAPDMYADLKYSGFAADIPDRAKTKLINKIKNQIVKYSKKTSNPIILVFNLVRAHDIDLHGILYSLQGSKIDHIVMNKKSEIVDRYWMFERDREFLALEEAKGLSAVIYYRNENTSFKIKLVGGIIINKSAAIKPSKDMILELEEILFK